MSFTLEGQLNQTVTLMRLNKHDAYGGSVDAYGKTQGSATTETVIARNIECRFVDTGKTNQAFMQHGPMILGKAQIWLDGDVGVANGDVVITKEGVKYTVMLATKARDVIYSEEVDHTHCILE